jgi:hypothetical protein
MKGAIVFLVVFAIVVVITLGNTAIPPGMYVYNLFLPNTEAASGYFIAGSSIDAVTAIIAVINGVIYAFIAWLTFTFATMGKKKEKNNQNAVVNIHNQTQPPQSPTPPPE